MSNGSVAGVLFLDQNGDGSQGSNDAIVAGATVSLYGSNGTVVATTTTGADGSYNFSGLANGQYYVQFSAPAGDDFSPVGTSATLANSVVGTTGRTQAITVAGAAITGQNAAVYAPVTLSGTVFTDSNDDGLVDGADKGLAGVTVQLLNAQGVATGVTATTAADGTYSFKNLAPGTWSVHVVMPGTPAGGVFSPYGSTTPPQPTGGGSAITQNLLTNGSFESSSFTTAAGYAGWTMSANTAASPYGSGPGDGPEIAKTNGANAVAIDPKGATNPYAGVVAPDSANPNFGGSGVQAAYFVDDGAIETLSQTVSLQAGQVYEIGFDLNETTPGQNNPGYFQLTASIGGQTITTAGSTSGTKLVAGTWTHFADLYTPATTGSFTLTFTYSSGLPGSSLASKDVLVDDVYIVPGQVTANLTTTSEVNANGNTAPVTLTSGESVGNESAGIYLPPATLTGTVFADANADGVKGAADGGLAGVTVNLTSGGTVIATAVTDANGNYTFANQAAGTYTVTVVAPSGNKFSAAGTSTTQTDSTVASGGAQTVTVANGGTAVINAGLYKPVTIAGNVFTDSNGDGAKQSTESVLAGQTVKLIGADGTSVVATTTTSASGAYAFTGIAPGSYTVQVVAAGGDSFSPVGTSATLADSGVSAAGASAVLTLTSGQSATVNAGEYVPGVITGTVFADANADGAMAATDPGLGGQTVNLIGSDGKTVIATTTTAANGSYSFTGIAPGSDTVQVVAPSGDVFSPAGSSPTLADSNVSAAGTKAVTVVSGSSATVNAGIYAPVSVAGTVFTDANGDGAKQADDAGLGGQIVKLIGADGKTVAATTTTSANGAYAFTGLVPGSYAVQVVAASGDVFSPNGSSTTLADSTVGATGASAMLSLVSGQSATVNAGEYVPGTIAGTVFADVNADGVKAATDAGLGGQTVNLIGADGKTVIATTTTAANGSYSFTGIAPGSDSVQVVAPAGQSFSPIGTSTSLPDSNVSAAGTVAVTVTSGTAATVNAGEFAPVSIAGTIFSDSNGDGAKQAGDAGLAGQTVQLIAADGRTVVATATTAADGSYGFKGIAPGTYSVQVAAASGEAFSPAGTSTSLTDSTVGKTGASAALTLTSGQSATVNAGEYLPGVITGTVFTDANADGAKANTDAGLGGQVVNLIGPDGKTVIATTTTDASGSYSFTGIAPGSDTIQVAAPAGDVFSPIGGSATLANSGVSAVGRAAVTIVSGSSAIVNAGVYAPVSVAGTVFIDANGDGARQAGEAGFAGQTVNLIGADGKTVLATTTTSATGSYAFNGLVPGTYSAQIVAATGDSFSSKGTSATLPDSSVGPTGASAAFTLSSGQSASVNAGEYAPSTIGGTVFNDANADGAKAATDAGLGGLTVNLIAADGKTALATTTTAANGSYAFAGLAPGSDTIQVIAPAGEDFSPAGTSATLPDSGVAAGGTKAVTVTSGSSTNVNAGLYVPGAVSGLVFLDGQATGTYHVGDPGVAGVTVALFTAAGVATGLTTTTGTTGQYSFGNLAPGSYEVQVVAPAGLSFSGVEHASGNPLLDSDVNPKSGFSDILTVTEGQTNAGANAGMVINGNFAGTTPAVLASGQTYDGNSGSGVITGAGNDLVHTGNGGNNVVALSGTNNLVEAGSGAVNDIVTSAGSLNAQTQSAANGYLFAGTGNSTLQGGQGNTYLVGGTGNNMVAGGSGSNVLVGGISTGHVSVNGTQVTGYTTGDEVRLSGSSDELLYQKGDGVLVIDGNFDPSKDTLKIFGVTGGTMETVNGQSALYLGGNDLIVFNGGSPFSNGTGSSFPGVVFNANITAAPEVVLAIGSNGLPVIVPSGTSVAPAAVVAAPVAPQGSIVTLSGYNQSVTLGNGNYTVSGSQGSAVIVTGNGNSTITAQGYNNSITTGSGVNTITAGAGNEVVNTGAGTDTVVLTGYSNLLVAGAGHPNFIGGSNNVYQVNGVGAAGGLEVKDFTATSGDVLDLSKELAQLGWNGSSAMLSSFLKVSAQGSATLVAMDPTGHGTNFMNVATLDQAGAGSLAGLQSLHEIKLQ